MAAVGFDGLLDDARSGFDDMVDLRRRLHRRPEVGLDLPFTQTSVLEALEGLPLTLSSGASTTSVVGVLEGERPGPTVILRGDMDGLPMHEETGLAFEAGTGDTMHACGHDAHTSMLVGAARLLSARRGDLAGRVAFMFQPGEEGHHGAKHMLEDGLIATATGGGTAADVAAAYALHVFALLPTGQVFTKGGPLMASFDNLKITIVGRGGHASAPHEAIDPIPVACELVTALNVAMTRTVSVLDPGVLTIGQISAGSTHNVIPETATILGTYRTLSARTRTIVGDLVQRVAAGVAMAHGCEARVELEVGFPVTVNDATRADRMIDVAGRLHGASAAHRMPSPAMGSEDWSYVLEQVPGAMAFIGCRPTGYPAEPNHSNHFVIDEDVLPNGAALYAALALDALVG